VGFGTRLTSGTKLAVNQEVAPISNPYFDAALYNLHVQRPPLGDIVRIDITDGPDRADFGLTGGRLFAGPYTVGANSNHIGLRLSGALPERQSCGELLSRGVPVGAIEAPPGNELLVLHRGRGVTAGYPVLAVVTTTSLNLLAQVRPGQQLAFRRVEVARATELARIQRDSLAALNARVRNVFISLGAKNVINRNLIGTTRALL